MPISPIPLYFQVEKKLREMISKGDIIGKGGILPSEEEFCKLFHVSRITVRKALSGLVLDGLISRNSGKGTFVLPVEKEPIPIQLMGSFNETMAVGLQTRMEIFTQRIINPPVNVRSKLRLSRGEKVFYYEGIRRKGKEPYVFFNAFVSTAISKTFSPTEIKFGKTIFNLLLDKTADIVSGGAWGRRPHTLSEPALLVN